MESLCGRWQHNWSHIRLLEQTPTTKSWNLQGKRLKQAVKSVTLLYIVHYQSLRTLDSTLNTTKARIHELKRLDCKNCIELSEPNRCDGGAARWAAGTNVRTARRGVGEKKDAREGRDGQVRPGWKSVIHCKDLGASASARALLPRVFKCLKD